MNNGDEGVLYLSELMQDRERLSQLPGRFKHVERLVDQEIVNVRQSLFDGPVVESFELPMPYGEPKLHKDRVPIPDTGRKFNFVGRLLGPRGKTLKRIEQDTGCKIMIRGEGSTRNANNAHLGGGPQRFDAMNSSNYYPLSPSCWSPTGGHGAPPPPLHPLMPPSGGPGALGRGPLGSPTASDLQQYFQFSPLSKGGSPSHHSLSSGGSGGMQSTSMASISSGFCNPFHSYRSPTKPEEGAGEPLHVLIQCEDTPNRARIRLDVAKNLITKLFQPVDDAHDELKQKQLLELSLMNGTFKASPPKLHTPRKQWPQGGGGSKSPSFSME